VAGKKISQIIGNLGSDPEDGDTSVGPVTRISVAVTKAYPSSPGADDGETRWVSVAIFKPSIREQVKELLSKGSTVCAEGTITESSYQGRPQFGMKASRVGRVEWFLPSAEDKAAAAARFAETKPVESTEDEW